LTKFVAEQKSSIFREIVSPWVGWSLILCKAPLLLSCPFSANKAHLGERDNELSAVFKVVLLFAFDLF
jgi:hypothetical protein